MKINKFFSQKSIRFKLALIVIISLIVLLIMTLSIISRVIYQEVALQKVKQDSKMGLEIIKLEYPGEWKLEDDQLYKGQELMNNNFEIIDYISELTGGTVTIFAKDTRVATNVEDQEGDRALGTVLSAEVKEKVLGQGENFYGAADVFGKTFQTAYTPLRDQEGNVVGVWYVGAPDNLVDQILANILSSISWALIIGLGVTLLILFLIVDELIFKPLDKFKEIFVEASLGNLEVRYPLEQLNCSKILGCNEEACSEYGQENSFCFFEVGSYAPDFAKEIRCIKIIEQAYNSCQECEVYRGICKDEIISLGAWLNKFIEILAQSEEEIREERDRAQRANQAKSRFLANMSHEIRTPLNAVIGFSEILEEKLDKSALDSIDYQSYLKSIRGAGNSLLSLINDILDVSKIEAGLLEIKAEWIGLLDLIQELESIFKYQREKEDLFFKVEYQLLTEGDYDFASLKVKIDQMRLRQILLNLVANAIKFTESGYVKLTVIGEKQENSKLDLKFIVEDTGPGIPDSEQENIFKAFTQRRDQGHEYGGTGLGLTITKSLVEQMGGKIELISELGEGSTFRVIFAGVECSWEKSMMVEDSLDFELVVFNSQEVLIVDDQKSNLEVLKILLARKGLRVRTAESGAEALELLVQYQPQLIFLDLKMPELDGYQTKDLIVENLREEVPIIALTAFATQEEKSKVQEAGFVAFLTKPLDKKLLLKELTRFLDYDLLLEEEKAAKEEIIIESDADLEFLVQILEDDLLVEYQQVKKLMIINELEEFGKKLAGLAQEYGIIALRDYARELLLDIDSFDLESLEKRLNKFPDWVEKLKQINE